MEQLEQKNKRMISTCPEQPLSARKEQEEYQAQKGRSSPSSNGLGGKGPPRSPQNTQPKNPNNARCSQEGGLDLFLQLHTQLMSKFFGS